MISPFTDSGEVNYPCPHHGSRSAVKFSFRETMTIEESKELEQVHDVDLDTFRRINSLDNDEELRLYGCEECDGMIMYFPESCCQYVV